MTTPAPELPPRSPEIGVLEPSPDHTDPNFTSKSKKTCWADLADDDTDDDEEYNADMYNQLDDYGCDHDDDNDDGDGAADVGDVGKGGGYYCGYNDDGDEGDITSLILRWRYSMFDSSQELGAFDISDFEPTVVAV
eukprot:TRINITY_DN4507_c0_g1_i1.p1 TRINITY_DN4507_c0_g1~~TRINITY_DN4507_c0_g1_i1.p1  ORF type:complete len:136 (-),score=35.01 TRINITY_DN4507_c0_g1_i1:40-447(-)